MSVPLKNDGTMDMSVLEKELKHAMEDDYTRTKTDEMKKRAIKVARDYDEFKNMVACATLKPLT